MATLKLTIAYDGTRYAGWQVQGRAARSAKLKAEGLEQPTIQGTLERVLQTILREPARVIGSGRTDAGVHALAQVAHLRTRRAIARERLLRSVNALLPQDIALLRVEPARPSFHARFDASTKRYRYRVYTGPVVSPFIRPYVHHVRAPLRVGEMRRQAGQLCGRHDFKAFARAGGSGTSAVRTVARFDIVRRAEELQFDVTGTGFLHTMVRSMVGTLLDIGRGRFPAGTIRRLLRTGDRRLAGTTAPAKGLTLVSVEYGRAHG